MTDHRSHPTPGAPAKPPGRTLYLHGSVVRGGFTLVAELEVPSDQVVAVLGPNGAGKSTLLHAVAGLLGLTTGHIRLGDRLLDDPTTNTFVAPQHRPVSVVFQDYRLFPHLNVRDNIAFAPRARGLSRRAAGQEAATVMSAFDLEKWADRMPATLSGGQAQRVALARAAAADPEVVLLDEPLAALDMSSKVALRDQLARDLRRLPGATLVVTHDPLDALVLADRAIVLEEGAIVQEGPPREVLARPGTEYIAGLTGVNLYRGVLRESGVVLANGVRLSPVHGRQPSADGSGSVLVGIPPTAMQLTDLQTDDGWSGDGSNAQWRGIVTDVHQLSDRIEVVVDSDPPARVEMPTLAFVDQSIRPGSRVSISVPDVTAISVFPDRDARGQDP